MILNIGVIGLMDSTAMEKWLKEIIAFVLVRAIYVHVNLCSGFKMILGMSVMIIGVMIVMVIGLMEKRAGVKIDQVHSGI